MVRSWRDDMAAPFGIVGLVGLACSARRAALIRGGRVCYRSVTLPRYRSVTSQSRAMTKNVSKHDRERARARRDKPERRANELSPGAGSVSPARHSRRRGRGDRRGGRHQQDDALSPFRLQGRPDPRIPEPEGPQGRRLWAEIERRTRPTRRPTYGYVEQAAGRIACDERGCDLANAAVELTETGHPGLKSSKTSRSASATASRACAGRRRRRARPARRRADPSDRGRPGQPPERRERRTEREPRGRRQSRDRRVRRISLPAGERSGVRERGMRRKPTAVRRAARAPTRSRSAPEARLRALGDRGRRGHHEERSVVLAAEHAGVAVWLVATVSRTVPSSPMRAHSGASGLAIQIAASASRQTPSGARGHVGAQTRPPQQGPVRPDVERREARCERFADDQRLAVASGRQTRLVRLVPRAPGAESCSTNPSETIPRAGEFPECRRRRAGGAAAKMSMLGARRARFPETAHPMAAQDGRKQDVSFGRVQRQRPSRRKRVIWRSGRRLPGSAVPAARRRPHRHRGRLLGGSSPAGPAASQLGGAPHRARPANPEDRRKKQPARTERRKLGAWACQPPRRLRRRRGDQSFMTTLEAGQRSRHETP